MSGLHPQVEAVLAAGSCPLADERDPAAMRADLERTTPMLAGPPEPVADVRDEPLGRVFVPAGEPVGVVLYIHGGGWVMGSRSAYDGLGRMLANAAGATVFSVDYRLSPEHPFPAALEDCEAALLRARELGSPVAVAGDSAGANLAAVLARRHHDLALQALVYPVLDAGMATRSYVAFAEGFRLTADDMAWFFAQYGGDPDDPDVSPLRAEDLTGAPGALVLLASHDVLRDEGEAYTARLRAAGVGATVRVYDGMVHGFLRWPAKVDAARDAMAELGAGLRAALRG